MPPSHNSSTIKLQSPRPQSWTRPLTIAAVVIAALSVVVWFLEAHLEKFYIFTPEHLHQVALSAIDKHGNDTRSVVDYIKNELTVKFPNGHINLDEEWIFNNAGGAMGAMYLLHASVTEYLIIFGSAVGTEGHTGRHTADDYFHILRGEQTAFTPGTFEKERYPQGSVHHLHRGDVKQYKMDDTCFALEYARGWIPPMLFFGYADTFSSTLDWPTLWRTTWVTGKQIILNLVLRAKF